jgi:hypothetical protein
MAPGSISKIPRFNNSLGYTGLNLVTHSADEPRANVRRVNVHTDCGRHTDDWLFGSFSLVDFLKRSIRHGWFHRSGGDHH